MTKKRKVLLIFAAISSVIYFINASWLTPSSKNELSLLSHRGAAQNFPQEGVKNETCTASRIYAPVHDYIENTVKGFKAAKKAGADIIELDIHPTTDGEFVVFHDWTLDCRTNGKGRTRDHDLATLKALDIGFGYTPDSGQTFPFRGQYVGAMPTLKEILDQIPGHIFINIKSRDPKEGQALANYVPPRRMGQIICRGASRTCCSLKNPVPRGQNHDPAKR